MSERRVMASPAELGEYLGVPEKTLANWRYLNAGPRYIKLGKHVRYRWDDVDDWVDSRVIETDAAVPDEH